MTNTYEKQNQHLYYQYKGNSDKKNMHHSSLLQHSQIPNRSIVIKTQDPKQIQKPTPPLQKDYIQQQKLYLNTNERQQIFSKYTQQRNKQIPLANQQFLRIQQIRKQNQKKMMELGLQPKKIYQIYYKKQQAQQQKPKLQQSFQHKFNERLSFKPQPIDRFAFNKQKNIRGFSFSKHQKPALKLSYQRNDTSYIKKDQETLSKQSALKQWHDSQKKSINQSQIIKSRYRKQYSRQQRSDNKVIQKFDIQGRPKLYSEFQAKQNIRAPIRKSIINIEKNKADDPRIQSIDRINNKIRLLLSSIEKDQKNFKQTHKQRLTNKSRDYIDQKQKKIRQTKIYQVQYTQRDAIFKSKLQAVEQRNKRIKKLEEERQAKFQQWKKNGYTGIQKKHISKPPLKPSERLEQKGWDDDIKRIQQKLRKVDYQKKKLQRQSAQKLKDRLEDIQNQQRLSKGSRISIRTNGIGKSRSQSKSILQAKLAQKVSHFGNYESSQVSTKYKFNYNNGQQQNKFASQLAQSLRVQIDLDLKLRQAKRLFIEKYDKNKWNKLKQQLQLRGIYLSDIQMHQRFTPSIQQTNPFKSQYTSLDLVQCYIISEQNFNRNILNHYQKQSLNCIRGKIGQMIYLQDMVRFVNMQCNTFYRNRDLYLLLKRMIGKQKNIRDGLKCDFFIQRLAR